jgi:hypothetical protein
MYNDASIYKGGGTIYNIGGGGGGGGETVILKYEYIDQCPFIYGDVPQRVLYYSEYWSEIPGGSAFRCLIKPGELFNSEKTPFRVKFKKYLYSTSSGANNLMLPIQHLYAFRYHQITDSYDKDICFYASNSGIDFSNIPNTNKFIAGNDVWIFSNLSKFSIIVECEYIFDDNKIEVYENGVKLYEFNGALDIYKDGSLVFENEAGTDGYLVKNIEIEFRI